MATIIPAIIPKNFEDLSEKISQVAGLVDIVQIDVMDGSYVKGKTWPYNNKDSKEFETLISEEEGMPKWDNTDFEVDMMVKNPEKKVEDWMRAGASRIILHLESTTENVIKEIIEDYGSAFVEFGVALKPSTPNSKLDELVDDIDFIQVMGSDNIGHSGEELDDRVLVKIEDLRLTYPEMPIAIDIGVNFDTALLLIEAGATRLVSGSTIFDSGDPTEAIEELRLIDE